MMPSSNTAPLRGHVGAPYRNLVLRGLPQQELALLEPHLQRVTVSLHEVLQQAGCHVDYVYFVGYGMISVVATAADGRAAEVAAVGHESVLGLHEINAGSPLLDLIVQIPGEHIRILRFRLEELLPRCPALTAALSRRHAFMFALAGQNSACAQFHQSAERLARWLLTVRYITGQDELELTHESIAQMLGTNRPTVSIAARTLAEAGVINYRRGHVSIIDVPGLTECSCECYEITRRQYEAVRVQPGTDGPPRLT